MHRSLGTHYSKIRSLDLDSWEGESLGVMCAVGNKRANALWEDALSLPGKLTAKDSHERRESFIRSKYVECKWLKPLSRNAADTANAGSADNDADADADVTANGALRQAVKNNDILSCLHALANGADVSVVVEGDEVLEEELPCEGTCIHLAAALGHAAVLELLTWHVRSTIVLDLKCGRNGDTAMHIATRNDQIACVASLLRAHADWGLVNAAGLTPLDETIDLDDEAMREMLMHVKLRKIEDEAAADDRELAENQQLRPK